MKEDGKTASGMEQPGKRLRNGASPSEGPEGTAAQPRPRAPKEDANARQIIATALDDTLVVEAAAGTGKTTELVGRIVRVLATGRAGVDNIVAVTFTEKAAGELKLRLREALDDARTGAAGAERDALNEALRSLEEAHVSTIHGFCAELLRERPVEARVDPLFTVLTEPQASRLFDHAFGGWIQAQLQHPAEGIRRALRRSVWQGFGDANREETPIDRLRRAAWELADWRDFAAPWSSPDLDRLPAIDALVDDLRAFAAMTDAPSYAKDTLYLDTAPARHLAAEIEIQREGARGRAGDYDYDGWEARLVDLSRDRHFSRVRHGRGPGYKSGVPRQRVIEAYDALRAALDRFRLDADADLAARLQAELRGAIDAYEALKARTGALDFLDLLLKARDLVRGNASVRRGFQRRFTHIFVDEFQDTDPLQAEILLLLAAADPEATDWRGVLPVPGRLFIVGDPKQSIYRFRRADVAIYREVCARLVAAGATHVTLTTSFRSVPAIQAFVNAAFAPVMDGDAATLQAEYVPLTRHRPAIAGQPAVVVLPVPEPYGTRNVSAVRIEESLPDATGAFVEWLIERSGWTVDGGRRVQARDVCILFRRFLSFGEDVTLRYVRALEARGVRHVLVGGKTFHDREEVETIRAALSAVEWPDDELSVFAALRGALFAIGDEELLEWKHRFGGFHPFRIPDAFRTSDVGPRTSDVGLRTSDVGPRTSDLHLQPIADALRVLQTLHRRRNYRPVAETVQALLADTRAHVGIVLRTAGEQALANVLHVAQLAREYEAGGGLSFRGFVDELAAAADTAQAGEAPILEEGSDGVRLMTVHKAKGLEFPIVILADLTCKLARADAGRWLDPDANRCALRLGGWSPKDLILHGSEEVARDRAEAQRLAYVAATRARDLLVVPGLGDAPYDGGWLDALTPAIYPPESDRRSPRPARGVPLFASKDTVLTRPDGDPATPHTVAPGTFAFSSAVGPRTPDLGPRTSDLGSRTSDLGSRTSDLDMRAAQAARYDVTWWDPRALNLGAAPPFGLRRDDLIVKTGDLFGADERLAEYERWRDSKAAAVARAAAPGIRFVTATAWAAEAATLGIDTALDEGDVEIMQIAGAANRPRGPRFGSLVHAVLAVVPLDADARTIERAAQIHARLLNADAREIRAAVDVAAAVLAHDLLTRARASASVRRETPVAWVQKDGTLVEGVLDLAFDEGDRTIVVDFKTDHELAAGETRYRAQLQQYVNAVARATARPASGILFRV
jgi:ATP-dependent exoDNAse (exonuclease V) beta subunit